MRTGHHGTPLTAAAGLAAVLALGGAAAPPASAQQAPTQKPTQPAQQPQPKPQSETETEPAAATVALGEAQRTTAAYPGAAPGGEVWELALAEPAEGPVTLSALAGPAPVAVYEAGGGPLLLAPGADLPAGGLPLAEGADGVRWAFGRPGAYAMTLTDAGGRATAYEILVAAPAQSGGQPDAVSERVVLDEGHLDVAARVLDGALQIHLKDGTVPGETTWREPGAAVLHVLPAAEREVPAGGGFDFLGAPGEPVWLLDQVQQDGLLWPGWSSENIEPGVIEGPVEFRLEAVSGPGDFVLFTNDPFGGANVLFNSGDGTPDTIEVPQHTHAHGGWAFTEQGAYELRFTMRATLASGRAVSDTESLHYAVGDVDPGGTAGGASGGNSGAGGNGGTGDGSTAGAAQGSTGGDAATSAAGGTGDSGGSGGSGDAGEAGETGGAMAETGAAGPSPALLAAGAGTLAALGAAAAWYATRARRRSGSVGS